MILDPSILRFRRQWHIGMDNPSPYLSKTYRLTETLFLSTHPDLRVKNLAPGVILLGVASAPPELTFPLPISIATLTDALDHIAGNYVLVAAIKERVFVFTDPGGLIPVFYNRNEAASSPNLLTSPIRDTLYLRKYPLGFTDDWLLGSYSTFLDSRVLLANHYLDVQNGHSTRFWPRMPIPTLPYEEARELSTQYFRVTIMNLPVDANLLLSLTGGMDSRLNLAALLSTGRSFKAFTLRARFVSPSDITIAENLSTSFGFPHKTLEVPPPINALLSAYDEITGSLALGARREVLSGCAQFIPQPQVHINGNLGAVAKAFYWPCERPNKIKIDDLLRDFVRISPQLRDGASEWLRSVPDFLSPAQALNLFYLEQRGGRWTAHGENGSSMFFEPFTPFSSRQLFNAISSYPISSQHGCKVHASMISRLGTDLHSHPYAYRSRTLSAKLPSSVKRGLKRLRQSLL